MHVLYGDPRSGNCYKVALMLHLGGLPWRWELVDVISGAARSASFRALNPNAKVPLLEFPDGGRLAESNAILLYLAEQAVNAGHGGQALLPHDPWRRAKVYQWLFFEQYSHEPYIAVTRFLLLFSGRAEQEAERIESLRPRGEHALRVMEQVLSEHEYIAGPDFTVADIALYAYTHDCERAGFPLREFPAVRAWLARIASRPGHASMQDLAP